MKEITIIGSPLYLKQGIVKLTEKQAQARTHCLKPYVDAKGKEVKDCYEIIAETCFKVGEVIGFAADSLNNLRPGLVNAVDADALKSLQTKLDELTSYTEDLEKDNKDKEEQIAKLKTALDEKKEKDKDK